MKGRKIDKVKKYISGYFIKSKKILLDNTSFVVFVIGNLLNAILVRSFTIKNYFAVAPLFADLCMILFIGSFAFLMRREKRFRYLFTISIVLSVIDLCNVIYYFYYSSYASITFLTTLTVNYDTGGVDVTENIFKMYFLVILLFPIVYYFINKFYIKEDKRGKDKYYRSLFKTALSWSLISLVIFACMLKPVDISRFYSQWNREYLVSKFGIYAYPTNDIVKSIQPKVTTLFGADKAYRNFKNYYKKNPSVVKKNKYTNKYKGKNVIVIHDESMQSIVMDQKFGGRELTPNLNKMAREGLYFSNFYSQVSVGTSSDTEFTFSTSLMPVKSGTVFVSYANREYVSIQKLLKEKGYYTFSMHANNGTFWNRKMMHKSLGYDDLYDKATYEINDNEIIGFGLSDKEFYRQSVQKIKEINKQGKPYYGTLITLSNHTPFSDVEKYGNLNVGYMEETKLGNYFKSVRYADEQLGLFLKLMQQEGLLDDTIIVLYGDHDARLPKSDFNRLLNYDKKTGRLKTEDDPTYQNVDYYWYELNRKVPFIIWTKDGQEETEVKKVMGMYDAAPTLGNMLGVYNKYQLGHDIFSVKNNVIVFPNGNWMTNKVYYNDSKNEYRSLNNKAISDGYIEYYKKYAEDLLDVSDDTVIYDLIKKDESKEYEVEK